MQDLQDYIGDSKEYYKVYKLLVLQQTQDK